MIRRQLKLLNKIRNSFLLALSLHASSNIARVNLEAIAATSVAGEFAPRRTPMKANLTNKTETLDTCSLASVPGAAASAWRKVQISLIDKLLLSIVLSNPSIRAMEALAIAEGLLLLRSRGTRFHVRVKKPFI